MTFLGYLAACLFMFVSHAIPSAPGVRPWLRERLGVRTFASLYSVISLVATGLFVWGYLTVDTTAMLYYPLPWAPQIAFFVMPVALFFMIGRITTPYGEQDKPLAPRGIYRIARFPGSFGILLWAATHLLATGDAKRVVAFATFLAIAVYALLKNQWVLKKADTADAEAFRSQTRVVPFHAISSKRQTLQFNEIGWRLVLLTLITFLSLIFLHPVVLGVNPIHWLYP